MTLIFLTTFQIKMISLSLKSLALMLFFCSCVGCAQLVRHKSSGCPALCHCRNTKAKCNSMSSLTRGFIKNLGNNVTELDLSGNKITGWEKGIFEGFDQLTKLNLSLNPLSNLTPDAFKGLKSLKTLDLSHTDITELHNGTFAGLQNLERLLFLESRIQSISKNSFDGLTSLSRFLPPLAPIFEVDAFEVNYISKTSVEWFSNWLGSRDILEDVLCGLPSELKGRRVNRLEPEIMHCDWPLQLPHFQLTPSNDQVIFQGDNLPIICQASFSDPSMNLSWLHNGSPIHNSKDISSTSFKMVSSSEKNMKFVTLELIDVDESFSGNWTCFVESGHGYVSRSLKVVVLSRSIVYCPPSKTSDNKGSYGWPSTMAKAIKVLPCVIEYSEAARASRMCNGDGTWDEPNTSSCPYVSEVTRMLGETASLNLSLPDVTEDNVLKMFHSIGPQTSDGSTIHDHTEICFLAKILEQLSSHSKKFEKIAGKVVTGLVNLSMNVSPDVLMQAQLMDGCCSRILKALEDTIANLLLLDSSHLTLTSRNVAIQGYKVNSKSVKGISCRSESIARNQTDNVSLVCEEVFSEVFSSSAFDDHRSLVFIPLSSVSVHQYFDDKRHNNYTNEVIDNKEIKDDGTADDIVIIIIILLRDPRLYPIFEGMNHKNNHDNHSTSFNDDVGVVSGPVLLANIVPHSLNMSPSIIMTIKNPTKKFTLSQVKWKNFPGGRGIWTKGDCNQEKDVNQILEASDYNGDTDEKRSFGYSLAKFSCQSLGAFSVILSPSRLHIFAQIWRGFREVSALVYVGCLMLLLVSSIIIFIYIFHWKQIEMSRKTHHAVVNLNLSLALLVLVFASGVKTYRVQIICQISTVFIHYFSISTQVWITIISFKLMHMLIERQACELRDAGEKKSRSASVAPEYLLGWGIPAILCGIGSAVDWEDRNLEENKICFLNKSAAILMFFLPSSLMITINLVFFIKIACISRSGARGLEAAAAIAVDHRDSFGSGSNSLAPTSNLEEGEEEGSHQRSSNDLLGRKSLLHVEESNVSDPFRRSSKVPLSEEEEEEDDFHGFGSIYPASSQTCGSAATMLLYCASWTTGMLAVADNPPEVFGRDFDRDFFGMTFLALSLGFSSFMAIYFCFGRKDVRKAISNICFSPALKGQIPTTTIPMGGGSSSSACLSIPPCLSAKNICKSPKMGCGDLEEIRGSFAAKLSVVVDGKSSVVFYDPRQNGAAKRYWEKVRKRCNNGEKSGNNDLARSGDNGLKHVVSALEKNLKPLEICSCHFCSSSQGTHHSQMHPDHHKRCFSYETEQISSIKDEDGGGHNENGGGFPHMCQTQLDLQSGCRFYETFAEGECNESDEEYDDDYDDGMQEVIVNDDNDTEGKHHFEIENCLLHNITASNHGYDFDCGLCKSGDFYQSDGSNFMRQDPERHVIDSFIGENCEGNHGNINHTLYSCNRNVWLKK